MLGDPAEVLAKFVDTIEATGGVIAKENGTLVPVCDEDWIDLGGVYEDACLVLGRKMKVRDEGFEVSDV